MLASLEQIATLLSEPDPKRAMHALLILPKSDALPRVPHVEILSAALKRRHKKFADLAKEPVTADLPHGALAAWVMLDAAQSPFQQQTAVRKGLQLLMAEMGIELPQK